MKYTEKQIREATEKWARDAYGNDEDFSNQEDFTQEEYVKACSDTLIEYLTETE